MNTFIVDAVLALLVFLSIATWTIAVLKIKQFKTMFIQTQSFQDQFWNAKDWAAGEAIVEAQTSDLAQIARVGISELTEFKKSPNSLKYAGDVHEVLERPMRQEIQKILRQRERGLAELASIGSISPFVGLFGTVWGIMGALQKIGASGQASIDVVAGPIGEALIATAIGIAAALPAVVFYNYFVRKMKLWSTEVDGFTEAFLRVATRQMTK